MKLNVEFLAVSYFIGMFVDWVFQWDWQAANKSNWGKKDNKHLSFMAVSTHAFVYAFWTATLTCILTGHTNIAILVFLYLFVTHGLVDTRIPVKWIMRFKGMSEEQITDYQTYGFMHIGIDHRLHELSLLILAFLIK